MMFEKTQSLKRDVLNMAAIVKDNLENTFELLFNGRPFKINDDIVDDLEKYITEKVVSIIVRERPYAHDLRLLVSTIRIISDLERIGDLSVNLYKLYEDKAFRKDYFKIYKKLVRNLDDAINALITENVSLAKEIMERDDEFDIWYEERYDSYINSDNHLAEMLIAKDIERIADHVTNIAEWTVFLYDGDLFSEIKRR